jgi:HD superfamily phosphohydrolase
MKIYDRIYKEMQFHPMIMDLLFCPGLLRLRDVRMANNQFVAFPAFASTTRYEHSLGVCYLAGKCAAHLELSEIETLELMIACLYHDVGTPPFAHAMEEVLQSKFGFDHEENLMQLIIGNSGEFDFDMPQIYQEKELKLKSICQKAKKRGKKIDLERIARIATGDSSEPLSSLVSGNGMDLDNIDNIIRASTAMGVDNIRYSTSPEKLAYRLAQSFTFVENSIYYNNEYAFEIKEWQRIRDVQYNAIFESEEDFAYQTMIKKAIHLLIDYPEKGFEISKKSWRLTDSSFTNDYLLKHSKSRKLIEEVLRCEPYNCLGILYVSGDNVIKFINTHLLDIENEISSYYINKMNFSKKANAIKLLITNPVIANFYPDKRRRSLKHRFVSFQKEINDMKTENPTQSALLGLFTPLSKSNYKTTVDNGVEVRRSISYVKSDLEDIRRLLSDGCLNGFTIEEFRSEQNGRTTQADFGTNQLGLFGI